MDRFLGWKSGSTGIGDFVVFVIDSADYIGVIGLEFKHFEALVEWDVENSEALGLLEAENSEIGEGIGGRTVLWIN